MNERDARRKQARLHGSSERVGGARLFDLAPAETPNARRPRNPRELRRGVEGILSRLGRTEEAVATRGRAEPPGSREGATAAMADRGGSRDKLPRRGEEGRARWVGFTLEGRSGSLGPLASREAKR